MGNDKRCPPFCKNFQRFLHHLLTLVIQRGRGLIKNQDRRIFQKHTGNGQTLLLPAGQLHASLADICVISIRKIHDKFMGIGFFCRPDNLFPAGIRFAIPDIFQNCSCKQIHILLHDSDMISQIRQLDVTDILSVHPDRTACHIIESWNQTAQSGFSCPGTSNQCHILPCRNIQIHMI